MRDGVRAPPRRLWLYAWVSFTILGAAGAVLCYLFLDERTAQWFSDHPSNLHRGAWANGFRQLGKAYVPIWLLLLWSFVTDRWKPTITVCLALILVSLTVCSLKAIVRRDRPHERLAQTADATAPRHERTLPWGVSFPSGDTAVAFAVAAVLTFLYRGWTPVLFAAAAAVGLFRVTALAHYPSDVVAGALIGVLAAAGAVRVPLDWPPQGRFPLAFPWRVGLALALAFAVPPLSPYLGMKSLPIFLHVYALPAAVLLVVSAGINLTKDARCR